MNTIQILNKLYHHIDQISDEPEITATVIGCTPNSIELDTSVGGVNSRIGHVLWPQGDNLFSNEPLILSGNITNTKVNLFHRLDPQNLIPIGTVVKINGGPLKESRKYFLEPDNVTDLTDEESFVTVGLVSHHTTQHLLGRSRPETDAKLSEKIVTVGVLSETFNTQKSTNVDTMYFQKIKPYVLSEQISMKLFTFLKDGCYSISNISPITVDYGLIQRDGYDLETYAVSHTITFTIK